jgi:serine/threonine protein kinase
LTEKIDVWSFGNNLYTILTGRYPFDDELDNAAKHLVPQGETATIDRRFLHRSKEEKAIVEVIEGCFKYYPHERPTMFEIVVQLQKALHENVEVIGLTREAVLQQISLE